MVLLLLLLLFTLTPYRDPGQYDIHLRWGEEDIPGFPIGVKILGEGRISDGSLCTAHGDGIAQGEVNLPAEFEVITGTNYSSYLVKKIQ